MKTLAAKMAPIVPVVFFALISGCITLPDLAPTPQPEKPVEMVNVPLSEICKEAKANEIRATELYEGKSLTVKGKIHSINIERPGRPAGVDITVGNVIVGLEAKDKQAIKRVSNGQTISASGVISSVGYNDIVIGGKPCVIILKKATF